jgi:hypothetical protein
MNHLGEMEYRETGEWGKGFFPDDVNDEAHHVNQKTLLLMVRVRDDRIRELVKDFRVHANAVGICRTREEERRSMDKMVAILEPLNERIGEILRRLDDDQDLS